MLETEKKCKTCKLGKTAWPNSRCEECMSHNLKFWEPNEETIKAYVLKCQPGEASVSVTDATEHDVVNKPKHYMLFDDCYIQQAAKEGKGIEVRDVISLLIMKMDECESQVPNWLPLFESDYVQLMQYLMRFMDKNGVEDLKKARWYLDKLIEAY